MVSKVGIRWYSFTPGPLLGYFSSSISGSKRDLKLSSRFSRIKRPAPIHESNIGLPAQACRVLHPAASWIHAHVIKTCRTMQCAHLGMFHSAYAHAGPHLTFPGLTSHDYTPKILCQIHATWKRTSRIQAAGLQYFWGKNAKTQDLKVQTRCYWIQSQSFYNHRTSFFPLRCSDHIMFCQPDLFTVSKLSQTSIDQLLDLCELNCDSSCNDICPFSWKYVFPEFQTWLITQFQSTRSSPMERYCPCSKKQGPVTFH